MYISIFGETAGLNATNTNIIFDKNENISLINPLRYPDNAEKQRHVNDKKSNSTVYIIRRMIKR